MRPILFLLALLLAGATGVGRLGPTALNAGQAVDDEDGCSETTTPSTVLCGRLRVPIG